jgi:hypothetical protein
MSITLQSSQVTSNDLYIELMVIDLGCEKCDVMTDNNRPAGAVLFTGFNTRARPVSSQKLNNATMHATRKDYSGEMVTRSSCNAGAKHCTLRWAEM